MLQLSKIELWVGMECTLNRVKSNFHDQCQKNGHESRENDIELFSTLGATKIRYPFLWETLAPENELQLEDDKNWLYFDQRMVELQSARLSPIVGLLHHGSGPRYTNLIDPRFPEKFARYARAFAERYPDIIDYTPINEPLTTARFSGLYGVWYPHGKDDRVFVRALYQQILATVLAMKEIRKINPQARLIQTEDLGRAQSTSQVKKQAEFENARRWLTFDMLCGKVDAKHGLYEYLSDNGILEDELQFLIGNATPPEVCGINHYPLSNRFLDHRVSTYPPHARGGNGQFTYADVGCIETHEAINPTPTGLLMETWERYKLPIAMTEIHARGHRENQLQWFKNMWNAAIEAKSMGAEICAVTAWSLLGTYDWNSLCVENNGFYEAGVFDVTSGLPRPTAISRLIKDLGVNHPDPFRHSVQCYHHPILLVGNPSVELDALVKLCQERKLTPVKSEEAFPDMLALKPWAVIYLGSDSSIDRDLESKTHTEHFAYLKLTPGIDPHYAIDCLIDQACERPNLHPSSSGIGNLKQLGRRFRDKFFEGLTL